MKKNRNGEEKKRAAEFVLAELERRALERNSFELQWRMNMSYVRGEQYCEASEPAGMLYNTEKQYYWQEREVFNHLAPIMETRLSRLSQVRPALRARPMSGDENDRESAEVATGLLRTVFQRQRMSEKIHEATVWSELCGTAFYRVLWNGTGTDGDVEVTVCSPFEIYPDSSSRGSLEECESIIYSKVLTDDEVNEQFGVCIMPKTLSVLSGQGTVDGVTVCEYFSRPGATYKNGRHIIVVDDEAVVDEECPEIPFVRQVATLRPGCFWGTSVVERCIPVQRAYNAVKNRKHEYLNRAAFGVLAVEENAMDTRALERDGLCPGRILVYRQGANPPQLLPVGGLPAEFGYEETALLQEFEMISGVSELMRRSYAGGASSGTALALLQEQDNTRLATTAEYIREAVVKCGRRCLTLYRENAPMPRMLEITGENGITELKYFYASRLCDDVVPEAENEFSQNLLQRRQMVFDLLARGLIDGSQGRARLLELLGMGDWESGAELEKLQEKAAQRENAGMKPLELSVSDNDGIHMLEHAKFMAGTEFERMAEENPKRAQEFRLHYGKHKERMEEKELGKQ